MYSRYILVWKEEKEDWEIIISNKNRKKEINNKLDLYKESVQKIVVATENQVNVKRYLDDWWKVFLYIEDNRRKTTQLTKVSLEKLKWEIESDEDKKYNWYLKFIKNFYLPKNDVKERALKAYDDLLSKVDKEILDSLKDLLYKEVTYKNKRYIFEWFKYEHLKDNFFARLRNVDYENDIVFTWQLNEINFDIEF